MSHSILSIRINSDDKKEFENFCENVGMNISVAVNMFVKTVIREQKLPFEIKNTYSFSPRSMSVSSSDDKYKQSLIEGMNEPIENCLDEEDIN